jgi:curved DNA-binding protein CbpA
LDPQKTYTAAELKAQYRKLQQTYHSDRSLDFARSHGISPEEAKAVLDEQSKIVNSVYDVLKITNP